MEEKAHLIEVLVEKATEYGKTTLALAKLKVLDKTSTIVSSLIPYSILIVFSGFCLLFLSLGLSILLGEILGIPSLGYLIVGGFYGLVGAFLRYILHHRIKTYIYNYILKVVQN
jgi:hypothetical protein